jgi:hypothetical protein
MDGDRGLSVRLYTGLMRRYPSALRDRFAFEMVQLFGDQLRDARARGAPFGVVSTWFKGLGDLFVTAASEHVRGGRGVGRSLARPPSPATRILAFVGILGGVVLLAAFVIDIPPGLNDIRVGLFFVGAMAVAVALYRPLAVISPRLALLVTAAVVLANAWSLVMEFLSIGRPLPPQGDLEFRLIAFYASVVQWLANAALGFAIWRTAAAARWIGMVLALASILALTGIDRFELVRGDLAWFWAPAALLGIGVAGLAWIALGIDVATRRRSIPASTSPSDREA